MNRRRFLNATALTAAATLARERPAGAADGQRRIEAVAFDGFAIFDPRPIAAAAEAAFPGKGAALMKVWRTRQFEYCWLRTLTRSYVNFWEVTQDALAFACAANNIELTPANRDRLMGMYLQLKPWPDVAAVLQALRSAGVRLAFLTNFTAAMLDANIRGAALDELFEARLSTDGVSAFKPDPRSYQMAVEHFKLPRAAIAFVAFGGWDAAGAKRFGFPVYWSNRLSQAPEELGAVADRTAAGLEGLPAFVAGR
jgi:2-haloacid dehalogenase